MKKNTKIIILVGVILLVIVSVVGVTYAFLSTGGTQEQANTFNSGCLSISLTNESASINLTNTFPITDIEGLNTTSYDFTIENTCNSSTNYQINLESLNPVSNTLDADYIKVSLSSDTVGNVISTLSDNNTTTSYIDGSYISHNLYTGSIAGNTTKTYHLRLWIDYDATVAQAANKTYESKINVIANPDIEVVDTLEATFELNDKTLTTNLTSNVTNATYCTTTDNICEPNTSASISSDSYNVDLSGTPPTKQVATALGNITVNTSSPQMICTRLNGTSKVICSNPEEVAITPDFSKTSCSSGCGEATVGIYETTDNDGTTYYWRGDVENNYVSFAGFYWRIIRVNGDGSIRLIYQGTSATATGDNATIGDSAFNSSRDRSEYVGLKYTEGSQYGTNENSTIYTALNTWYEENINIEDEEYTNYIDTNVGFCGDRDMASGYEWSSQPSSLIRYAAFGRLVSNKSPVFTCSSNNLYTATTSNKGNKSLSSPIGLITADEVAFAGGVYGQPNEDYYLNTESYYWTLSPSYFYSSGGAVVFAVANDGLFLIYNVNITIGVRPVINLKADTQFTGSGTSSDPFVVV